MMDATARDAFFMMLYQQVFPALCRYVSKRGGTLEDAKDIFQDSVIIYYEKRVAVPGATYNHKAYLMGIAKHLWLKRFTNRRETVSDEVLDNLAESASRHPEEGKLLHYLETAGKKCMELLKAFYYDQLPVQSVARLFGYSGLHSASVQKYKCLERVRDEVKQKSLSYEDFLN